MSFTLNIDMDEKCKECGKGGSTPSGLCLACAEKAISGKPMKSREGQIVRQRFLRKRDQWSGISRQPTTGN